MSQLVDKLAAEARQLSADERVELVETILAQLPDADPDWDAAWTAEAEQRMAAVARGDDTLIPTDKVMENLRNKYRVQ